MTALGRNRTGGVYHRADCPRVKAGSSIPWLWADGMGRAEVQAASVNGVKPCKVCDPLGGLDVG